MTDLPAAPPVIEWMPDVRHVDRGGGTPVQTVGPVAIVLHTTETQNRASYKGSEPHFEVDRDGSVLQYISLGKTAKALYNYPTGAETNRRGGRIIQFELVNRAADIETITDAQLDGLALAMRFVDSELPFAKAGPPQGFHGADEGIYPYLASEASPIRFTVAAWEAFGGICGHQHVIENCVSADTPMLGSDLRWRPAGEYVEGDELLAFDEHLVDVGSTGGRRLRPSIVERNHLFRSQAVRVVTEVGSVVTTIDHPWLARLPYVNRGTRTVWVKSLDLTPDRHEVYFAAHPWVTDRTHDAGWLAGVLDADGHVQVSRDAEAWVGFGQVHGPLLDRFFLEMEARGFLVKRYDRGAERGYTGTQGAKQPFADARVTGGLWEQLRCLGTLRPHRLDLRKAWDGAVVGKTTRRVKVLAVERLPEPHWFAGMQTSTRTYIAGGFLMHNTHWDPGRFPLDRLLSRLGIPSHPTTEESLPMEFTYIADGEDFVYLGTEGFFGRLPFGDTLDGLKAGKQLADLGHQTDAFHAGVVALADTLKFIGDRA